MLWHALCQTVVGMEQLPPATLRIRSARAVRAGRRPRMVVGDLHDDGDARMRRAVGQPSSREL